MLSYAWRWEWGRVETVSGDGLSWGVRMFHLRFFTPLALAAALLASVAAPTPLAAQQAYAYQNPFDDSTGWTLNGLWAVDNTPAVPNGSAGASGGNNLNYNNGSSFNNAPAGGETARGPTINMTGVSTAAMTFWCRYQTETTGTAYDQRWIRIYNATSGAQVYTGQFSGSGAASLNCPSMSAWHQHTFDPFPAAALNIPIQLEFWFYPVDTFGNDGQGWFIDDIEIVADDVAPPDPITDLALTNPSLSGVDVEWSSPADNDLSGQAQTFDLRYSTQAITEANFGTATQVNGEPSPGPAGTVHTMSVTGLNPGTEYFFAIKSTDPAANESLISNVESVTTLALPPVGGSATNALKEPKDRYNACAAGAEGAPVGLLALAGLIALAGAVRTIFRK